MVTSSHFRSLSLLGVTTFALFASACSSAELDSEPLDEGKAQAMAEDFEFAPDEADSTDAPVNDMEGPGKDEGLVGKGSDNVTRGFTWYEQVSIPAGTTVTYRTEGGAWNGVDPVLVLFMRTSPWNSTDWVASPWTQKVGLRTLAQNDDSSGADSSITWTNNEAQPINAWVMGFAWENRTGSLRVYKDGADLGYKAFASGSVRRSSNAGEVYTTGGGDPVLFAFETSLDQQDNGAWNDDDPTGGTDSRIQGFTNRLMWLVPVVYYSQVTRNAGTSTIYY